MLLLGGMTFAPATAVAAPSVRINEVRVDQTGADNDEYFELLGTPGMSLDDYTYISVGDGALGDSGVIESVTSLAGMTMPWDGYFVCAEFTFTLGTPDLYAGASGLNFENLDNETHMLVRGFSGALATDIDTNDDGVIDFTPWATEVDRVAFAKTEMPPPMGEEWHYGPPTVGPAALSTAPGHAFRNSAGWHMGSMDITPGLDTPGAVNPDEPWAVDDPGLFATIEEAEGGSIAAGDNAGNKVAISDDLAVVGATGADSGAGAAFVYERDASGWTQTAELRALDRQNWENFGSAVAIAGETIFVGASGDTEGGAWAGAVYVFTRSGDTWSQSEKLRSRDTTANQAFGYSLAANDDTLLVGSQADDPVTNAGAVYVFGLDAGTWVESQRITAPDAAADDNFGHSVALSGDTLLVGAPFADLGVANCGACYTFTRSAGTWSFEDKLTPSFEIASNYFGQSVALDGDRALVGILNDDTYAGDGGGAAYFTRTGSVWTEQAILGSASITSNCAFGQSVALSGSRALVGAYALEGSGAAFVYEQVDGVWRERRHVVAPDAANSDWFGYSVAMSGDEALVGSQMDDTNGTNGGSAYFLGSTYHTAEDTAFTLAAPGVLANDTAGGPSLTAEVVSDPAHGEVAMSASGEITYTPEPDFWGSDTFTYRAYNGTVYSAPATVTVTVTPVNDAPSFTAGADVTVAEDSGAYAAPWASAVSAGPANESAQDIEFTVQADDTSLFAVQPAVADDGTLSFTPAADAYGSTTVGVQLTDDDTAGGPALSSSIREFTITVTDVYDVPPGSNRIAGDDRYLTAVKGSGKAFPVGADTVVVATGANWPDALGGSALAGAVGGPLLLTKPTELPADVSDEIERLGASTVYILGGLSAVSAPVATALDAIPGVAQVIRLEGADRYATARKVADTVIDIEGAAYSGDAFVATGSNFPDALAASPLAAWAVRPILLADPRTGAVSRPAEVTGVTILGGEGAVSAGVEVALNAALGDANVDRIGGANRYETGAKIAAYGAGLGMSWNGLGVATGKNFPDGLSGGAMLGALGTVMLLTPPDTLAPEAKSALEDHAAEIDGVFILGGNAAITPSVEAAIRAAAGV